MTGPASSQGDFVHLDQQDTSPHEGVMTGRGRSVDEAIAYGQSQIDAPTQSWSGLCQSFVRHAYGVPAWGLTAYDAWLRIPEGHRHAGPIGDAPRGSAIYFKRNHVGAERPGHVVLATRTGCMSNDITRPGMIDRSSRDVFAARWNMVYLGWSLWTPWGDMP